MSFVHTTSITPLELHHGDLTPLNLRVRFSFVGADPDEVTKARVGNKDFYSFVEDLMGLVVASDRDPSTVLYSQIAGAHNCKLALVRGKVSVETVLVVVKQIMERFAKLANIRCDEVTVCLTLNNFNTPQMLKANETERTSALISLFNFGALSFTDEYFEGFTSRYGASTTDILTSSLRKFAHHKQKLDWLDNPKKLSMANLFKELKDEVCELENYTDELNFIEELGDVFNYLVVINDVKKHLDKKEQK